MRELRLPSWKSVARLLAPLDLFFLATALELHAHPARIPALLLVGASFLCLLALLFHCVAWVSVIAFFGRSRAQEGSGAVALLFAQVVCLLCVLWLAAPALQS